MITNLESEIIEQLVCDKKGLENIDKELIEELQERYCFKDDFDKNIGIVFELVIEQHLDPLNIDLVKFSRVYLKRVKKEPDLDLITAGKLIFMAWSILKLQSDEVLSLTEEEEHDVWDDIEEIDWWEDDDNFELTLKIKESEEELLEEKIRRKGSRKVTIFELIDALKEAKNESEKRIEIQGIRENARIENNILRRKKLDTNIHKDDLETDIMMIWERINKFEEDEIKLSDICNQTKEDMVTGLVSVLFLASKEKVEIWQDNFPYGEIFIKNIEKCSN